MAFPLLIDRYSSELMQFLRLACVTEGMGPLEDYKYAEMISPANERAALQVCRTTAATYTWPPTPTPRRPA